MKDRMKRTFQWIKSNYWLFICLIIMFLYLYSDIFFDGKKLSFMNVTYIFSPFNSLNASVSGPLLTDVADNLLPGMINRIFYFNFSSWNPNIGLGVSQSLNAFFFIFKYIYLLPLDYAVFLMSFVKFGLAFLGMYLFCKELTENKTGSFVAGIVFTFSSAMVAWHGWEHTDVAMLAPLLFYFTERFMKNFKIKYLFFMITVLTSMFFAGMATYVAYFLYLLGAYVLFYGIREYWKTPRKLIILFLFFGLIVAFSALISLPYTGELLTSVGANGYTDSRKGLATISLEWSRISTVLFPYMRHGVTSNFNESTLFTGTLSVFILPLTLINVKMKKRAGFWLSSVVILLLLVYTSVLTPFYTKLPMVNTSLKIRLIILLNFSLSVLFALNIGDIFENGKEYVKKKWQYLLVLLLSSVFVVFIITKLDPLVFQDDASIWVIQKVLIVFFGSIAVLTIVPFLKQAHFRKVAALALILLTVWDSGGFAKNYLPLLNRGAESIPESTDSIRFLQDNTKDQEKFVATGAWTFYPAQNTFYGLRDIRIHDFVATNKDFREYYTAIAEDAFPTPTRVEFKTIENENLLKYMGVKFIVEVGASAGKNEFSGQAWTVIPPFAEGSQLTQEFVSKRDRLSQLNVLSANYGHTFGEEQIYFKLIDVETDKPVREGSIPIKEMRDNEFLKINFPSIEDSGDKQYRLELTSNNSAALPITFYQLVESGYDGAFVVNGEETEGNLVLQASYEPEGGYLGKDGLAVRKLDSYSDQFELIETIEVVENEKQVLDKMKAEYHSNRLYINQEEAEKLNGEIRLFVKSD
ncbi:hypothetical protein IW492_16130 [Enterococcus sp. BWB1-3]|uniref:hypothetical protein n=1 Tax=Enterococcus sp. BWB1-3 TaxID=2787713 RepID=UPI001923669C|nr:hypothetical protein [Enterococcus sp. BWB1-3]MBL1230757.1 hypothetical protein [Enterococcus sp. BWB1-3]